MTVLPKRLLFFLLLIWGVIPVWADSIHVKMGNLYGELPIKTWKEQRDDGVIKQNLDYSCGAASVATVLSEFYRKDQVTEKRILEIMNKDSAASFQDLAQAVKRFEMRGVGLALSFAQLKRLRVPAVAYLKYQGDDHFSVIRGISQGGNVRLADPSWGNRTFSKAQFRAMWETREEKTFKGKILLILPAKNDFAKTDQSFFSPPARNGLTETLLGIHMY